MAWYVYIAYFFAGIFIVNGIPHFVHGVSGKKFQSPFASPLGVGESSSLVNVFWGIVNFILGFVLIFGVGEFTLGFTRASIMVGSGAVVMSLLLSLYFGYMRSR
ncbi:hypothetical protein ACFLWX_04280 [Chloroflexota bacterium]